MAIDRVQYMMADDRRVECQVVICDVEGGTVSSVLTVTPPLSWDGLSVETDVGSDWRWLPNQDRLAAAEKIEKWLGVRSGYQALLDEIEDVAKRIPDDRQHGELAALRGQLVGAALEMRELSGDLPRWWEDLDARLDGSDYQLVMHGEAREEHIERRMVR